MIDDAFGHWFAGFIDGEGCFWIHREKGGGYYAPHFKIKLRADDTAILDEIAEKTRIGRIFSIGASNAHGRNNRPGVVWMIQSRVDCLALIEILDRFPLRAKKARDYTIWRDAVMHWKNGKRGNRWHGPRDWTQMLAFKAALEAGRAYR